MDPYNSALEPFAQKSWGGTLLIAPQLYVPHFEVHLYCFLAATIPLPGEGNGTPLQYSCLENPIDGGAWWAAVHGVAKSQT